MGPRDQLELFLRRWDALRETRLARDGYPNEVSVQFRTGEPMWVRSRQPDEELLRSLLVVFRPFIAKGEPAHLYSVYNTCQRYLTSDRLKGYLRTSRHIWAKAHKTLGIRIEVDGERWTPEHILDLWINGWYFHNDPEKLRKLQRLFAPSQALVRMEFLGFLGQGVRQVLHTGNIIRIARQDGLFTFPT